MARKTKLVEGDMLTPDDKADIVNFARKKSSAIYQKALKFYPQIVKAYENKDEDANKLIGEYWNIYNATPDDKQTYQGNSKCYVPVVRDAINARAKRSLKQLFPTKYRHVDAVGSGRDTPYAQLSLLEHYIRTTKLRSIVRSLLVAGDVTGQWCIYVDWLREVRNITGMIRRNPILQTVDGQQIEAEDSTEEVEEEQDQEVVDEGPDVIDFAVEDLAVIPPTVNHIEKADITAIKLRMSKEQVRKMVDDGIFILPPDTDIAEWVDANKGEDKINPEKKRANDAGIKTDGTLKYALIFEAHVRMKIEGKKKLVYIYYAGENKILGIIEAPHWGQKRPIISAPVDRVSGSFFGISKIEAVKWLQWNLNDFWNMGQDSAMYSLLPIVMTDPEANPNYAMMVYGLAAVWPVDPKSTQFASFPQLWQDSMAMCSSIKAQINESLDVNEMMMGRMPTGRKNAQMIGAQMQEQSVAILDHSERVEEELLNPLMERWFEYDCQFRDTDLTVITMGQIGVRAAMQVIEPQQWGQRFFFQWTGTSFVMNMQRMQQQIATMNVLRGVPPQQMNGLKLDISPILKVLTDNVFGADLSSQILIDDRNKYTVAPEIEDEMMVNGIPVQTHESDDDAQHLQVHSQAARSSGDAAGLLRNHMQEHVQQMQKKRQMAMAAMQPPPPAPGHPGVPGGAGPGVAGTPRPGAQPQMPRPGQQPAGAIHPDVMPGGIPRG